MKRAKKMPLAFRLGIVLILCSLALLLAYRFQVYTAKNQRVETVSRITSLLPPPSQGIPGLYSDPEMPAISLDGKDYLGLLEVPAYGVTLPVGSQWDTGKLIAFPCRFWGSAYDSTLVIGGSDEKGLLDFCSTIDLGAYVFVTDMTGARYTYTVSRVDRAKHAQTDWLLSDQWDLTLFAQSSLSMEYIALRCSLSMQ